MTNSAFRIIREMFYGAATTSDNIGFVDINEGFTFVVYERIDNDAFVLWINNDQSESGEYLDYALYYIPEAPDKMPDIYEEWDELTDNGRMVAYRLINADDYTTPDSIHRHLMDVLTTAIRTTKTIKEANHGDIAKGFVVIEGLDGAGTTTQAALLGKRLEAAGIPHITTKEPTDGPIGRLIRQALRKEISLPSEALAMLYAADRADHLYGEDGVMGHLDNGELVVSDRYFYSSIAYQGLTLPADDIRALNDGFPHPELLVFVDTPVEECMRRIASRGEAAELFEKEDVLRRTRDGYMAEIRRLPEGVRLLVIDGTKTPEKIADEIWTAVKVMA